MHGHQNLQRAAEWLCTTRDMVAVLERYFFRMNAIKAPSPPTTIIARITRSILNIQATPIPSAAHLNHQCPGDVITLMITKSARITGPTNKNLTARKVLYINMILFYLRFYAYERGIFRASLLPHER